MDRYSPSWSSRVSESSQSESRGDRARQAAAQAELDDLEDLQHQNDSSANEPERLEELQNQDEELSKEAERPEDLQEEADDIVEEDDDHLKQPHGRVVLVVGRMSSSKGAKRAGGRGQKRQQVDIAGNVQRRVDEGTEIAQRLRSNAPHPFPRRDRVRSSFHKWQSNDRQEWRSQRAWQLR